MSDTLLEKYAEATSVEIMDAIKETEDKKEKALLMKLLRSTLRQEETALRDDIQKDAEDSKEEKRLLKTTHVDFMEKRKAYLEAYRAMNVIINGMSMLKNLDDFSTKAVAYMDSASEFREALEAHLKNLNAVKAKTTAKAKGKK
jgi:hypothetical protein